MDQEEYIPQSHPCYAFSVDSFLITCFRLFREFYNIKIKDTRFFWMWLNNIELGRHKTKQSDQIFICFIHKKQWTNYREKYQIVISQHQTHFKQTTFLTSTTHKMKTKRPRNRYVVSDSHWQSISYFQSRFSKPPWKLCLNSGKRAVPEFFSWQLMTYWSDTGYTLF